MFTPCRIKWFYTASFSFENGQDYDENATRQNSLNILFVDGFGSFKMQINAVFSRKSAGVIGFAFRHIVKKLSAKTIGAVLNTRLSLHVTKWNQIKACAEYNRWFWVMSEWNFSIHKSCKLVWFCTGSGWSFVLTYSSCKSLYSPTARANHHPDPLQNHPHLHLMFVQKSFSQSH